MSLYAPQDECMSCFKYVGWVGERKYRYGRPDLICTCDMSPERKAQVEREEAAWRIAENERVAQREAAWQRLQK